MVDDTPDAAPRNNQVVEQVQIELGRSRSRPIGVLDAIVILELVAVRLSVRIAVDQVDHLDQNLNQPFNVVADFAFLKSFRERGCIG